jgi:hypothetical protein
MRKILYFMLAIGRDIEAGICYTCGSRIWLRPMKICGSSSGLHCPSRASRPGISFIIIK